MSVYGNCGRVEYVAVVISRLGSFYCIVNDGENVELELGGESVSGDCDLCLALAVGSNVEGIRGYCISIDNCGNCLCFIVVCGNCETRGRSKGSGLVKLYVFGA